MARLAFDARMRGEYEGPQSCCSLPQQILGVEDQGFASQHEVVIQNTAVMAGCDQVLNQVKIPDVMQALQDL